jgi:hypothetical protein
MMDKEGGISKAKEEAKLINIRKAIDNLAVAVKKGEPDAMQRSAHLAAAAGKISARIGEYENAGTYYKYGSDMLKMAGGAGYATDARLAEALELKADRMYRIKDKLKHGKGSLEEHAEVYSGSITTALIAAMLIGGVGLMGPNITGNVTGEVALKVLSVCGMCLFAIGLILGYVYLSRRKR